MTQQLGETREQMARDLMKRIEKIINETPREKYYILVHGKPFPNQPNVIKMKYVIIDRKPSMMLSCMLFEVDNRKGSLKLLWALPGDWPVLAVDQKEPVPETIASYNRLDRVIKLKMTNRFFEKESA